MPKTLHGFFIPDVLSFLPDLPAFLRSKNDDPVSSYFGMFSVEGFNFRELHQYLFYGKKGNGKSMVMAYIASYLARDYRLIQKKFPHLPRRTLYANTPFSKSLEDKFQGQLKYWENPRQLYSVRNADILWDEIGKDLPADDWKNVPKKLRAVFSHLRKRGNRLFANTQVYDDIAISFRRQVDRTFWLKKVMGSPDISATLPPVKTPWGLVMVLEQDISKLNANTTDSMTKTTTSLVLPRLCLIERALIESYDTTAEIPPYRPTELEHLTFKCLEPGCNKVHVEHRPY